MPAIIIVPAIILMLWLAEKNDLFNILAILIGIVGGIFSLKNGYGIVFILDIIYTALMIIFFILRKKEDKIWEEIPFD